MNKDLKKRQQTATDSKGIRIRCVRIHGNERWVVDCHSSGKRTRSFFGTRREAEAEAKSLKDQRKVAGEAWLAWAPSRRMETLIICREIQDAGVTLRQVWERYQEGSVVKTRKLLGEVVRETVEAKRDGKRRERYVKGLEDYLEAFAMGRETTPVDSIQVAEIEQWFGDRKEIPVTRASNLGRLAAMFSLAKRRGYIRENPCDAVERVKVDRSAPRILTVDQAKRVLFYCRHREPELLPWTVLVMLCGVRHEEYEQMAWGNVDLARGRVVVPETIGKTRRQRIVDLDTDVHPMAHAWLKLCSPGKPSELMPSTNLRRKRTRMARLLKIEWHQDILRHTCASYLLGLRKDPGKVAPVMGNSPRILLDHYRALVPPEVAERFYGVLPNKPEVV